MDSARRKPPPPRAVLRLVGSVAIAAGSWFALRHLHIEELKRALIGVSGWPIALAMLINLGPRTAARTLRTLALLRVAPQGRIGFRDLFALSLGSYAAGYLVPGPAEEVVHTAALARFGFRLRDLLATHALDKALGVLSTAFVAVPILPTETMRLGLGATAALAFGIVIAIGARSRRGRTFPCYVKALACLLISNLLCVAMLWLCLISVGERLPILACLQIFAVTACACALPLAPGHIGVLETAFVTAATRLGVAPPAALAAGLVYHCAHVAPLVLAGLPTMIHLLRERDVSELPTARSPACVSP